MSQWLANINPWAGYQIRLYRTPTLPISRNWGSKSLLPPFKLQPNGRISAEMSIEHIWERIGWLWSDATNNHTAFDEAPNEWTQKIEHNMCGRWAAWSPMWWWWWCEIFIKHIFPNWTRWQKWRFIILNEIVNICFLCAVKSPALLTVEYDHYADAFVVDFSAMNEWDTVSRHGRTTITCDAW